MKFSDQAKTDIDRCVAMFRLLLRSKAMTAAEFDMAAGCSRKHVSEALYDIFRFPAASRRQVEKAFAESPINGGLSREQFDAIVRERIGE